MKPTRLGQNLIEGLNDVIECEKGKRKLRISLMELPEPAPSWNKKQISNIRIKIFEMSQPVFAALLDVSPSTIKAWEQGLKRPSGAASRLLQIISSNPDVIKPSQTDKMMLDMNKLGEGYIQ